MFSRNKRSMLLCGLAIVSFMFGGCGSKEEGAPDVPIEVNLLSNPSFEQWTAEAPRDWALERLGGEGENRVYFGRSSDEKNTGNYSFYMRGVYNTDEWYVLVQRVPIIPDYMITLSGAMSSKNIKENEGQERRANIFLRFLDREGNRLEERGYADLHTANRRGTTPWSIDSRTVRAPRNAYFAEVGVVNSLTGFVYFDDISLVIEEPVPWQTKESKYITYYYLAENPMPDEAIERETELVESYADRLGIKVDQKLKYFYYPSEEKLKKMLGIRKGHQRALWDRKELHTTDAYEDHIVVHLLLSHFGYPPYGLAEGIVFALIENWFGEDLHLYTKENLIQRRVPALYKILTIEEIEEEDGQVVIPAWGSFCLYLIDTYGMEAFMELYKRTDGISDSSAFNVHFKELYEQDFPAVDRDWRLYVLRYQGPAGEERE